MSPAAGPPLKIMLIRHAEKPTGRAGEPLGVTEAGSPSDHSLTVRGWQRAGALAVLFARQKAQARLAVPGLLVCPGYADGITHRVLQSLQPLAGRLGVPIHQLGTTDNPQPAIDAALSSLAPAVLVCWDHQHLPALAALVPSADLVPSSWPPDRFDLVWVFDRVRTSPLRYGFSSVEQGLLEGDAPPGD